MKKLFLILPVFFLTLTIAAQTEDEVYIGKGKTFGNYKSANTKPINGQIQPIAQKSIT